MGLRSKHDQRQGDFVLDLITGFLATTVQHHVVRLEKD